MTRSTALLQGALSAPAAIQAQDDPASLSRLADIAMPPPVSWWPPAPGWWVIIAVLLACVPPLLLTAISRYHRNAYRRAALAELDGLPLDAAAPMGIGNLLKRTAMVAAGRRTVARLSGEEWVDWLNARLSRPAFTGSLARALTEEIYRHGFTPSQDVIVELRQSAHQWIRRHR
jgi:Domain of unknown function (DUF4381)